MEVHDANAVYKTDDAVLIYLFHYSYDDLRRCCLGSILGSDHDVLALVEDVSRDIATDGVTQTWSESLAQTSHWSNKLYILQ